MNAKERLRLQVVSQISDGTVSLAQGAARLGLGYRQMRRVKRCHDCCGDGGLVHWSRGKASNRLIDPAVREKVLALCRGDYAGFGRRDSTELAEVWCASTC